MHFFLLYAVLFAVLVGLCDFAQAAKLSCWRLQNAKGWTLRGDKCYLPRFVVKRKYAGGTAFCTLMCSTFIVPNDAQENEFLRAMFATASPGNPNKMWIGCSNADGPWKCIGETATYRNWPGPVPIDANQCAMILGASGDWDTADCDTDFPKWSMCETPAQPPICSMQLRCYAVATPTWKCPKPFETFKVTSPMECCRRCAVQCNCESYSITDDLMCQFNARKFGDPVTILDNKQCTYYEYQLKE